jgi:hypothetical protein
MPSPSDRWGGPPPSEQERQADCPGHQYAADAMQAFRWGCAIGHCRYCGKAKGVRVPRAGAVKGGRS